MDNLKQKQEISYEEAVRILTTKALIYSLERKRFRCAICADETHFLRKEGGHLRCACCHHTVVVVKVIPAKESMTDPYQTIKLLDPREEILPAP